MRGTGFSRLDAQRQAWPVALQDIQDLSEKGRFHALLLSCRLTQNGCFHRCFPICFGDLVKGSLNVLQKIGIFLGNGDTDRNTAFFSGRGKALTFFKLYIGEI